MKNNTEIGTFDWSIAILADYANRNSLDGMFSVIGSRGPRGE